MDSTVVGDKHYYTEYIDKFAKYPKYFFRYPCIKGKKLNKHVIFDKNNLEHLVRVAHMHDMCVVCLIEMIERGGNK